MAANLETGRVARGAKFDAESLTFTAERKLRESGNSIIITVPPDMADAIDVEADDRLKMVASIEDGEIVLRPDENDDDHGE
jgi:hypothetical protein